MLKNVFLNRLSEKAVFPMMILKLMTYPKRIPENFMTPKNIPEKILKKIPKLLKLRIIRKMTE